MTHSHFFLIFSRVVGRKSREFGSILTPLTPSWSGTKVTDQDPIDCNSCETTSKLIDTLCSLHVQLHKHGVVHVMMSCLQKKKKQQKLCSVNAAVWYDSFWIQFCFYIRLENRTVPHHSDGSVEPRWSNPRFRGRTMWVRCLGGWGGLWSDRDESVSCSWNRKPRLQWLKKCQNHSYFQFYPSLWGENDLFTVCFFFFQWWWSEESSSRSISSVFW